MPKIIKIPGEWRFEIVKMKDDDIVVVRWCFKFFSFLSELNSK